MELTPELAGATLDYFVSCGDRLSQMTKTYHDIDAVTRLLQEKEKDLELAAKIGQVQTDPSIGKKFEYPLLFYKYLPIHASIFEG